MSISIQTCAFILGYFGTVSAFFSVLSSLQGVCILEKQDVGVLQLFQNY